MCRILIADNELSLVAELERRLSAEGHRVIGNVVSGRQAVAMAGKERPDLVLMEIKLSGDIDGITAAIRIRSAFDIPTIFITWYGDRRTLGESRWAHPAGYVLKPVHWPQLNEAIEAALSRKENRRDYQSPSTGWYVNSVSGLQKIKEDLAIPLTPMETRIGNLIMQGNSTQNIALRLNLKKSTVHWHQKNIRRKMGLVGRRESLMSALLSNE